jgi:predicted metalloprotease with PDZ domain
VPSALAKDAEGENKSINLSYSLGMKIHDDGTVSDVKIGSPAQKAGIAPNVKVIAINRRVFSGTNLRDAMKAAMKTPEPLEFIVRDGEVFKIFQVDYHAGEKYPHLVRDETKPDLLSAIIAPMVKEPSK